MRRGQFLSDGELRNTWVCWISASGPEGRIGGQGLGVPPMKAYTVERWAWAGASVLELQAGKGYIMGPWPILFLVWVTAVITLGLYPWG